MNQKLIGKLAANGLKLAGFSGFDLIELNLKSTNKKDVLVELSEVLAESPNIESSESALRALAEREDLASTGMGFGVATPHGRSSECSGLTIAFGRSKEGIEFGSFDGEPVYLFFGIIVPISSIHLHLQVLASLSILLREPDYRQRLMEAEFPQEVLDFLNGQ